METRLPIYELVDGAVRGLEDGRGAPHSGGGHSEGDQRDWHPSAGDQPLGDKNAPRHGVHRPGKIFSRLPSDSILRPFLLTFPCVRRGCGARCTPRILRFTKPGRLIASMARPRRGRRMRRRVLALLSLTNYSVSAQRPIVDFTREYTWDIESKER